MDTTLLSNVQGELERLFDLDGMLQLSQGVLGFDPQLVGSTGSPAAFARALVSYCRDREALPALVDAMIYAGRGADPGLRGSLSDLANGELSPGTKVGDLQVVKKIGEGGLSRVYLAERPSEGDQPARRAALKVIRPEFSRDRAAVLRFTTAARFLQGVHSDGLAPIFGVGELSDARPWVAAQYMPGQTLAERLKRGGALHINEAQPLLQGVLEGLAALHRSGIVHADVKVENVFVHREEGQREASGVLVDAGADRLLSRGVPAVGLTGLLPVLGTAKAIAPEQARGAEPDVRSDIYSVGTLLYEVLTGRPPFVGPTAIDVVAGHLSEPPTPPSQYARKGWVSEALDTLVLKALSKDPADRQQTVEALLTELQDAIRRPSRLVPLDEEAFETVSQALAKEPADDVSADVIEGQARASDAWSRAASLFEETSAAADDISVANGLLFRAARIYEVEMRNLLLSESAYQRVLDRDPSNEAALQGVEDARRARQDFGGLIEALLERIDRETTLEGRMSALEEVAGIYENELGDHESAVVAWLQALVSDPGDAKPKAAIERLAKGHEGRWQEVMETLSATAAELRDGLDTDDAELQQQAEAVVATASEQFAEVEQRLGAVLHERRVAAEAERAAALGALKARQEAELAVRTAVAEARKRERASKEHTLSAAVTEDQAIADELAELETTGAELQERLDDLEAKRDELEAAVAEKADLLAATQAEAEERLYAYETLETAAGEQPTAEQAQQLGGLADQAEALVEKVDEFDKEVSDVRALLTQMATEIEVVRVDLTTQDDRRGQLTARVESVHERIAEARDALESLPPPAPDNPVDQDAMEVDDGEFEVDELAVGLAAAEQAELDAAKTELDAARETLAAYSGDQLAERQAQREQDRQDLVALHDTRGGWYGQQLRRLDLALACYQASLELDPGNEVAHDGVLELHRTGQAWGELSEALLRRSEVETSPVKARDFRAEAAVVIAEQLGDQERARVYFDEVLEEDPAHELAQAALADLLMECGDFTALAELLERRVEGLLPEEAVETRLVLADLYEGQLRDHVAAQRHYEAALGASEGQPDALKGLERLYAQAENYEGLLSTLLAQVDRAATPKQRIGLLERIGALQEEDFMDLPAATASFEGIVAIDPGHEAANTALTRLYRQLSRFEEVVETLDRHAGAVADEDLKVELLMQAERVLAVELNSPERAMEACERVLALDENHVEVLAELARLRSSAGQVPDAVRALTRLAERANDPLEAATHLVNAAQMLEDAGDRDDAIGYYRRALDADRYCAKASDALHALYRERGDTHGTIEMLRQTIMVTEGDLKRAQLFAELGTLFLDRLDDDEQAGQSFQNALGLEPSNAVASFGMGRLHFKQGNFELAADLMSVAIGRLDDLEPEQGAKLCSLAGEAYRELGDIQHSLESFKRARQLQPDVLSMNEQHADAVAASGDFQKAEELYASIVRRFEGQLEPNDQLRLVISLGEAQLRNGSAKAAVKTLSEVMSLRPDDPELLTILTEAQLAAENWNDAVELLQQRAALAASEEERFELLVATGDVFLDGVRDPEAAAQTFVTALDLRPESRNLLTKLMGVYSDTRDWPRLIEVILRIAEMVDDQEQLSKYYTTAATIAKDELGRFDEAANYYEEAIAATPVRESGPQFDCLVECLTQNQDWDRLERAYEARIARLADHEADSAVIAGLMDRRAEVVRDRLGRNAEAMHLFEEAQRLEPDNQGRREMLTEIYTREPKRFFQQAVFAHREMLAAEPQRVESLQALRKVYTSVKKPDESWCLCQALRCLQMADVDEEKFFKKYRLNRLAKFKHVMDENLWHEFLMHPEQDPVVTAIFATLSPAIFAVQGQALSAFGVGETDRVDAPTSNAAMARMLSHGADAMGMRLPDVYHVRHDSGGLSLLFTAPPALGIGQGALAGGPQQALAFVAARHLSYYRLGHLARQLVPTGTGLRAWMMAAIRLVSPGLPIPPNMQNQVTECERAVQAHLVGPQRESLRSFTQKLLDASPELDMKRWMAGVDLTADRIGFVLSNDLKIACAVIEASPIESSVVPREDRDRALLEYSVSEPYFELRKRLGIALGK